MKSFKLFFDVCDSSFSIAEPYMKEIGELEINLIESNKLILIKLVDNKDIQEGLAIHRGLRAIVNIQAESMNEATEMARVRVEGFLTMLTFITNATVGEVELYLGYETTEDVTSTEYIQIEYLKSDLFKRKRMVDHTIFQQLGEKLLRNNNKRISRAVRWYRKGLIEVDPLDRFMSYWIGLENLNNILMEKLGHNTEVRLCSSCGAPYKVPTAKGIRSLFEKYSPNGLKDFKICRDLRVDLQHGSGDLESVMNDVNECLEICRFALLKAIYISIDFSSFEIDNCQKPIYNIYQPRVEFRGHYHISPKDLTRAPILLINTQNFMVSYVDGKRTISFTDNIDSNIPVDMTIEMTIISEQGIETNVDVKAIPKA